MLYKFIFCFLISTVTNILFEVDLYLIFFISLVFLMSVILAIDFYKTFLSDIIKMSFIIFTSFIMSYWLVSINMPDKIVFHLENSLYNIEAKVVDVSFKDTKQTVSLEVKNITNLSDNTPQINYPKYIDLHVSPLNKFKLYDEISLVGEIENKNNFSYGKNFNQNFLTNNYNSSKLFLNTNYQVSNLKSIDVTQDSYHQKSLWERLKINFYETANTLQKRVSLHVKDPYTGIAQGITFGDQERIIKDIKDIFIDSGLIHIMVLSGANVSFIILIFFWLLKKCNLRARVFATTFLSTVFIFMTGLTAPSVRAGVMVNSTLISEYLSRNFSIKKSILLSLFILTLINPFALVYSASLHLSYLAIFGLVFIAPEIYKIIDTSSHKNTSPKFEIQILLNIFSKDFVKNLLSVFLGITVSVGPYLLAMSGKINFLGTIASIILEPIILAVTVLTFLITFISFLPTILATHLADILGILNSFLVSIILRCAEFLAQDIFIFQTTINPTLVKIYYLIFILYFFVLNQNQD